jgi:hypothetical protein
MSMERETAMRIVLDIPSNESPSAAVVDMRRQKQGWSRC